MRHTAAVVLLGLLALGSRAQAQPAPQPEEMFCVGDTVPLRAERVLRSRRLGRVARGTRLRVIARSGPWVQVKPVGAVSVAGCPRGRCRPTVPPRFVSRTSRSVGCSSANPSHATRATAPARTSRTRSVAPAEDAVLGAARVGRSPSATRGTCPPRRSPIGEQETRGTTHPPAPAQRRMGRVHPAPERDGAVPARPGAPGSPPQRDRIRLLVHPQGLPSPHQHEDSLRRFERRRRSRPELFRRPSRQRVRPPAEAPQRRGTARAR